MDKQSQGADFETDVFLIDVSEVGFIKWLRFTVGRMSIRDTTILVIIIDPGSEHYAKAMQTLHNSVEIEEVWWGDTPERKRFCQQLIYLCPVFRSHGTSQGLFYSVRGTARLWLYPIHE